MLSIFSYFCWPSVCLLWRNVCIDLSPIVWLGSLFFWYWAVWVTCIFWRLILFHLQLFSPILRFVFSFCLWLPLLYKRFSHDGDGSHSNASNGEPQMKLYSLVGDLCYILYKFWGNPVECWSQGQEWSYIFMTMELFHCLWYYDMKYWILSSRFKLGSYV